MKPYDKIPVLVLIIFFVFISSSLSSQVLEETLPFEGSDEPIIENLSASQDFKRGFYLGITYNIILITEMLNLSPGSTFLESFYFSIFLDNQDLAKFTLDSSLEELSNLDSSEQIQTYVDTFIKFGNGDITVNEINYLKYFIPGYLNEQKNAYLNYGYILSRIYAEYVFSSAQNIPISENRRNMSYIIMDTYVDSIAVDEGDDENLAMLKISLRKAYFEETYNYFVTNMILQIIYNLEIDMGGINGGRL